MTEIYHAPAFNFDGYARVEIIGKAKDTRGQEMVLVRAINGKPWDDVSHGGWVPTNINKFYPKQLKPELEQDEERKNL